MILIADPTKPFLRAPKGTFVRKLTMNLYADAIEALSVGFYSSFIATHYDI
jgi:hypothetical protein